MNLKRTFSILFSALLIASLTLVAAPVQPARAASFVVTKAADTNDGVCNADCSLREAITAANANGVGADTITFAANYTITLTSALPDITTEMTIDGNGAANTIVQASTCDPVNLPGGCTPADWRVFTINDAVATLKDLTARYGNCDACADGNYGGNINALNSDLILDAVTAQYGYADYGGGIYVEESNLTIQNGSSVDHNKSLKEGGGIYPYAFNAPVQFTINNSQVNNNATVQANSSGGGIFVEADDITVLIENGSQINNNSATYAGGAIYIGSTNNSSLTVDASTISGNQSTSNTGGGIYFGSNDTGLNDTSTLAIQNGSLIDNNTAGSHGGGVYADTIGNGLITTIDASTISNNESTSGKGGGIYFSSNKTSALTIQNGSLIDNNAAGSDGGGVYISGTGVSVSATINNSTVSANTSKNNQGGGIYVNGTANIAITNSTLADNQSTYLASTGTQNGGGIYNNGTLTIINSTLYNNYADRYGGGLYNAGGKTATLVNNTISHGYADSGAGVYNAGTLHLSNNIIANASYGGDCINDGGTLSTDVNNLIEVTGGGVNACGSPASTADPMLGSLADNGGPTQTMALGAGSPAIDAGNDGTCAVPATVNNLDQRGDTRPKGSHCDIGAYEFSGTQSNTASIIVNTDTDTDDGYCDLLGQGLINQDCTLREAINAVADGGTITFAANYTITLDGSQLPIITTQMTITGNGAANTIVQASTCDPVNLPGDCTPATYRVFEVGSAGDLTLDGVTVKNGNSSTAGGGASNSGILTIKNSIFETNFAENNGGVIYSTGTLNVSNASFHMNSSNVGGAINSSSGSVQVTNSTFTGNTAQGSPGLGGAIYLVSGSASTIDSSSFVGNHANYGGAIHTSRDLKITNSTLDGNIGEYDAGGIYKSLGSLEVINSTLVNNQAIANKGGGIYHNSGSTTVTNSTISGNYGGGIFSAAGTLTVTNSTLAENNNGATFVASGIHATNGSLKLTNTIIALNIGFTDCTLISPATLDGASSNNWVEDGGCDAAYSGDPMLGELANNGGPTQTHALLPGSGAIDTGTNTGCPATDQRGVTRPRGAACDIGSFEFNSLPTSATFGDVPLSHPYWEDIEILYANGFTAGCSSSPLLFCPQNTMNRGESAVFILRGNFGSSYVPPNPPYSPLFSDNWAPGPWAQKWAQGMLEEGLTAGCSTSPLLYCPWEQMPRLQAAVFGMRLKEGNSYIPPAATGNVFADITDPNLWYAKWAEAAYTSGILPACGTQGGKPLFCPNQLVSRGLGAYMIVRAKNLSMP